MRISTINNGKERSAKAIAVAVTKDQDQDEDGKKPKKEKKEWEKDHSGDAEKRMQEMVRLQGRLTKKGGVMMSTGTSEFQIAGGDALERLVNPNGRAYK